MALDLYLHTRPDELGHFYLGPAPTILRHTTLPWLGYRTTIWRVPKRDGSWGVFQSTWLFGHLQWYAGDAKCDATRTFMYWHGQLDNDLLTPYTPDPHLYVYTDLPSELSALRWRSDGPGKVDWTNMGGS